ncbi:MAG: TlyA family RNA methyltransferase [Clostridia bacterium]|nr:TlyA family RNA methyltransferase [Clostridia bacterium]
MERLDKFLFLSSVMESREKAKTEIIRGNVFVNGKIITKPSYLISENDEITLGESLLRYVGKGGEKLEAALHAFEIDLHGKTVIDIGASTGGFTDCMLQHGAEKVFAVDVGDNQIHHSLLHDDKVVVMENTDIRNIEKIDEAISFFTLDVSFISIRKVMPNIIKILGEEFEGIILLKPQFEVGKLKIGKSGVVKDKPAHRMLLQDIVLFLQDCLLAVIAIIPSPVKGKMGNIEYLIHVSKGKQGSSQFDYINIVDLAFLLTKK